MVGEEIKFDIPKIYIKNTVSFTKKEVEFIKIILDSLNQENLHDEIKMSLKALYEKLDLSLDDLLKLIKSLGDKTLEVTKREEDDEYIVSLFRYLTYNKEKDSFKFLFNEFLDGFFLKLKYIYDKTMKSQLITLRGKYSWQTYEMLKTLETTRKYYASIDYLRKIFDIDSQYKLYADFKRKVLLYTQKEINEKTDIEFSFEEVKNQRKIIGINIIVKNKGSL